ncbi:hypothetical protein V8C86DRAFT_3191131, partial [Haematococcus lacustris]
PSFSPGGGGVQGEAHSAYSSSSRVLPLLHAGPPAPPSQTPSMGGRGVPGFHSSSNSDLTSLSGQGQLGRAGSGDVLQGVGSAGPRGRQLDRQGQGGWAGGHQGHHRAVSHEQLAAQNQPQPPLMAHNQQQQQQQQQQQGGSHPRRGSRLNPHSSAPQPSSPPTPAPLPLLAPPASPPIPPGSDGRWHGGGLAYGPGPSSSPQGGGAAGAGPDLHPQPLCNGGYSHDQQSPSPGRLLPPRHSPPARFTPPPPPGGFGGGGPGQLSESSDEDDVLKALNQQQAELYGERQPGADREGGGG